MLCDVTKSEKERDGIRHFQIGMGRMEINIIQKRQ